uniref:exodeoxyribonuclease III n=1 Tax=Aquarana catesbeiana TaxID=8400 RepID=C1C4R5_AQUCT|nr:LINE-1 reverse transcriptase homolog [Aquarana catesbeiana]
MARVKIVSYNVRGLNVAAKRHQVYRELKQATCSIAFLQETHLTHTTSVKLTSPNSPQWYYSLSDTNKAKGVAIGFCRNAPFRLSEMLADDHGRFLFLRGFIGNTQCTLANIYCPNHNQPTFLSHILTKLSHFAKGLTILAGDINMPLDPSIDTSQNRSNISFKRLKFVKKTAS